MPTLQAPRPTRKPRKRWPAVPAKRVREMLLEIAFVLHATRVVGRVGQTATARQGQPGVLDECGQGPGRVDTTLSWPPGPF